MNRKTSTFFILFVPVKNKGILPVLLYFLLFGLNTLAQNYSYKHFTILDGLPQNQLTEVFQDSKGFIWIAAKTGIARFDGKTFKRYYFDKEVSPYAGFFEYNRQLFCYNSETIAQLRGNEFHVLFKDTVPLIYHIKADTNTNKIILSTTEFIGIHASKGLKKFVISDSLKKLRFLHLINDSIFLFFDNDKKIYEYKKHQALKLICEWNNISDIAIDDDLNLFILREKRSIANEDFGLYKYSKHGIKKLFAPDSLFIYPRIFLTASKKLLLIYNHSMWKVLDTNGTIIDSDQIPNTSITKILIDKSNNYWFATENGLYYQQSKAFRNYDEKSGIPAYIWSVFETKDSAIVFASYYKRIALLKDRRFTYVEIPKDFDWITYFYCGGFCGSDGVWYIPTEQGLLTYNTDGFKFLNMYPENRTLLASYEDTLQKCIYWGANQGFFKYELQQKTSQYYPLNRKSVLAFERDKYKRLWVCTSRKIFLYADTSFTFFRKEEATLNHGAISCKRDYKGNMWLASSKGLWLYLYHHEIKISHAPYFFISIYKNKFLITGGVYGLLVIDLEKFYELNPKCVQYFDKNNGFIGKECAQNATYIDTRENIWIPTSESVIQFKPERINYNTQAPQVFFYELQAAKSDLNWEIIKMQHEWDKRPIKLNYPTNNVRIKFHAPLFSCQERVKYKYRLLGYNQTWIETDASNEQALFTNLKPGKYTFELRAANENNFWNTKPTLLNIEIIPAFCQTLIFKIALFALILIIMAYLSYYIIKRKRQKELKEQAVQQQLIAMQMNTINAQLDPHFVFNAITAIGSEVQSNNTENAYQYFVKVAQLLRKSLKDTNQLTRSLNEELQFVENYLTLQKLRFEDRLEYFIDIDPHVDRNMLLPKMCIQIFVENALKHGIEHKRANGKLHIKIFNEAEYLKISIQDNGIGRAAARALNMQSTGIGLKVFNEFFTIINRLNTSQASFIIEDLEDETSKPSGTRVVLKIPFNYQIPFK